jgi:hypothetical protein
MSAEDANRVVTDRWLIGFTEAEVASTLSLRKKVNVSFMALV